MQIISFEGIDGCGKTTVLEHLKTALEGAGKKVAVIKFPRQNTPIGNLIYDCLLGRIYLDEIVLHALYEIDRLEYNKEVKKLENDGYDYLLCDRHFLSNRCFADAKGLDDITMYWLSLVGAFDRKPTKTYILDISVEESFKRRPDRRDKHENNPKLLEKVRLNYVRLANAMPDSCVLIDGSSAVDEVVAEILTDLQH